MSTADEYIKRWDAIGSAYQGLRKPSNSEAWERLLDALKAIPSADVVEVVRCRDCGYRDNSGYCEFLGIEWFTDEDFCPYGWRE